MNEHSRRNFLKVGGAAGAGAAAMATLPGIIGGDTAVAAGATGAAALAAAGLTTTSLGRSFIVHVKDAASGEISILHGDSEVTHRDPDLVARVIHAAGKGN
jgi:hypothetical protein